MIAPTFAEIVGEARRHLEDAEEVLRLPWRGENPTDDELDALDEARGHIATAKSALSRMKPTVQDDRRPEGHGAGEEADAVPRSRKRTPPSRTVMEPKVRSR